MNHQVSYLASRARVQRWAYPGEVLQGEGGPSASVHRARQPARLTFSRLLKSIAVRAGPRAKGRGGRKADEVSPLARKGTSRRPMAVVSASYVHGCRCKIRRVSVVGSPSAGAHQRQKRTHVDDALRELATVLLLHVLEVSLVLLGEVLRVQEGDDDCSAGGIRSARVRERFEGCLSDQTSQQPARWQRRNIFAGNVSRMHPASRLFPRVSMRSPGVQHRRPAS